LITRAGGEPNAAALQRLPAVVNYVALIAALVAASDGAQKAFGAVIKAD
jgi:hypothetical protein